MGKVEVEVRDGENFAQFLGRLASDIHNYNFLEKLELKNLILFSVK